MVHFHTKIAEMDFEKMIISDAGTNVKAVIFKEFCRRMKAQHTITSS